MINETPYLTSFFLFLEKFSASSIIRTQREIFNLRFEYIKFAVDDTSEYFKNNGNWLKQWTYLFVVGDKQNDKLFFLLPILTFSTYVAKYINIKVDTFM